MKSKEEIAQRIDELSNTSPYINIDNNTEIAYLKLALTADEIRLRTLLLKYTLEKREDEQKIRALLWVLDS